MIAARVRAPSELWLYGTVRGLASEAGELLPALDALRPGAIGLGLSEEELAGLNEYFAGADAEEVVPLTEVERREAAGLSRFGEVRVPNPTFVAVLEWARERTVPVEALDAPDAGAADMFTRHIGYVELVRRTLRERKLSQRAPEAASAEEFSLAWDEALAPGEGSRAFARERDAYLARAARALVGRARPIAVVIDRERFALVTEALEGADAAPTGPA